jgi:hypothetical protein
MACGATTNTAKIYRVFLLLFVHKKKSSFSKLDRGNAKCFHPVGALTSRRQGINPLAHCMAA